MYLWKAPYIKLFSPELYRQNSTVAKNPCCPQNLLGHRSTAEHRVGARSGSLREGTLHHPHTTLVDMGNLSQAWEGIACFDPFPRSF